MLWAVLCRAFGSPREIVGQEDLTREVLARVGRGRLTRERIDALIQRARDSIGIRQAGRVIDDELRAAIDLIEDFELQIAEIESELERRMNERASPLPSLGIGPALAAAIHAESDPASDCPRVSPLQCGKVATGKVLFPCGAR